MAFDEWMTDPIWIEKIRAAMGSIDLDPASNKTAQESVKAKEFYTAETNGLRAIWKGNVFCNPPYSKNNIDEFVYKGIAEWKYSRGLSITHSETIKQMIFLVNSQTDTAWYQDLMWNSTVALLVRKRIKFWKIIDGVAYAKWASTTSVKKPGKIGNSPRFLNTLFYFGDNESKFIKTFKNDGTFVKAVPIE